MDYKLLASQIIELVGGESNINSVQNCMTRLRFVLKNEDKAKTEEIKVLQGVLGVAQQGGQYQIIIGPNVPKVMAEITKQTQVETAEAINDFSTEKEDLKKSSLFNSFFKTISGCIMPILGILGAAGLLKGFLAIATTFGWMTTETGTYYILYALSDAALYFMPIILGFSCGKVFNCNPYTTAVLGAALVYPNIVAVQSAGEAIQFVGIPVILTSYANSVFPIILASYVASKVEKQVMKFIPQVIQLMFVPMITLVITGPLTFLVVGPIMTWVSNLLAAGTQAIYGFSPIIAGAFLGAFWQLIVIFGLHYAFIPILINNIVTMGEDPVNAILGVTVFALCGAALGFALKIKNKEKKALGFSTMVSGLVGITEPIIYGIAIPYRRTFACAFIGGGIAGAFTALRHGAMQGFGGAGLLQGPLMVKVDDSSNFVTWMIASALAFFISAVLTYFFGIKKEQNI